MDITNLNPVAGGFTDQGSLPVDNLIANSDFPIRVVKATLVSGQTLPRGSLVGKITSGGKLTLSLTASSDGSQNAYGILAADCDASGGDKDCLVYISGVFSYAQMNVGASWTQSALTTAGRLMDLHIMN